MNYFDIEQVELWRCNMALLSDGILKLKVVPISDSRQLIWIEFYDVVYVTAPTAWSDVNFYLASQEECLALLRSLRQENFNTRTIDESEFKLFSTKTADVRILAKTAQKIVPQK